MSEIRAEFNHYLWLRREWGFTPARARRNILSARRARRMREIMNAQRIVEF